MRHLTFSDYIYLIPKIASAVFFWLAGHWFWVVIVYDILQEFGIYRFGKHHTLFWTLKLSLYEFFLIAILMLPFDNSFYSHGVFAFLFLINWFIPFDVLDWIIKSPCFPRRNYIKFVNAVSPVWLIVAIMTICYMDFNHTVNLIILIGFGIEFLLAYVLTSYKPAWLKYSGLVSCYIWFIASVIQLNIFIIN